MDVKGFYDIVGGDYDAAKLIMMNDAFIERMLGKFFANNTYKDIIDNYEKKDFKAVFAAAHSFKGVVGNLALTPLFNLASTITEATRNQEAANIEKEISELKEKYALAENAFRS